MGPGRHPYRFVAGALIRGRIIGALGPAAARRQATLRRRHTRGSPAAASRLYEEIWADGAQAAGATLSEVRDGRREAHRDGRTVRIDGNTTDIDSPEACDRLLDGCISAVLGFPTFVMRSSSHSVLSRSRSRTRRAVGRQCRRNIHRAVPEAPRVKADTRT